MTKSSRTLTPLQKGLAFYKGKTLTLIEPGATGAIYDLIARSEAPYLGAYLHATVNVEDVTIGNSIPGQDDTAGANPDGLTLGLLNMGNDASLTLTHTPGLNFNPTRLEFIAANGASTSLLIASSSSPYTSLKAFLNAGSAVTLMLQNSGIADVQVASLLGIMGAHNRWLTGYTNLSGLAAGFARGDAPTTYTNISTSAPFVASGKARTLMTTSVPPVGTAYRQYTMGVPTIATIEKDYPPKTKKQATEWQALNAFLGVSSTPLVTQTNVASYKLVALRAAAVWMFHQAGFHNQMLSVGQNPTYLNPVTAKTDYITVLNEGGILLPFFQQFT